jgi:hypothetical protein
MTDKLSAEQELAIALKVHRELWGRHKINQESDENAIVARNVLHEELGYIGTQREPYHLNDDTRDILIAHARQDSAHALSNTISLLRIVARIERRQKILFWVLFIGLALALIVLQRLLNA